MREGGGITRAQMRSAGRPTGSRRSPCVTGPGRQLPETPRLSAFPRTAEHAASARLGTVPDRDHRLARQLPAVAVSFDAVNLTEEIQKEYYKFADSGGPDIMNFGNVLISRQFALGVRWKY